MEEQLSDQGWEGGAESLWGRDGPSEISYSFNKSIDNLQCSLRYGLDGNVLGGRIQCSRTEHFMGNPYEHL